MHPPGQRIEPHDHDWPVLTVYRLGGYREQAHDGRTIEFDGPSVVFQPPRAAHANTIGPYGLETLALQFDPVWLSPATRAALPTRTQWRPGGKIAARAATLAGLWLNSTDETALREHTSQFLLEAFTERTPEPPRPAWIGRVAALIDEGARTSDIARATRLNPAWLARAYRAWRGEGMAETLRRRRVERAVLSVRASAEPLAEIAAACGFCDQSHMNRAFRTVLGRTPLDVQREAVLLAPLSAGAVI